MGLYGKGMTLVREPDDFGMWSSDNGSDLEDDQTNSIGSSNDDITPANTYDVSHIEHTNWNKQAYRYKRYYCVYNYDRRESDDSLDSSSPLSILIRLSSTATAGLHRIPVSEMSNHVTTRMVRFDGSSLLMFSEDECKLKRVVLSPQAVVYSIRQGMLRVDIHRKFLPHSRGHSNVPFRLVIYIEPSDELVWTPMFFVFTKRPPTTSSRRRPTAPKRIRKASPKDCYLVDDIDDNNDDDDDDHNRDHDF